MAKLHVKSTETNLLTISACTAALWPCMFAAVEPNISAIHATQDNKVLRRSARADHNALLEYLDIQKAIETATNQDLPLAAVYADQKSLL